MSRLLFVSACVWLAAFAAAGARVISLSPALTEIICALGAQKQLVGRSSACDYPAEVRTLPVCGNFAQPVFERIVALDPDMIVADIFQDANVVKGFRDLGIRVEVLPLLKLADYPAAVARLGELLDVPEAATALRTAFDHDYEELKNNRPAAPPKTLVLVWELPFITFGNQVFLNEYLELAGGVNLAAKQDAGYFTCTNEWALLSSPEVILSLVEPTAEAGAWQAPDGWEEVPAVVNHRAFKVPDDGRISRLGPRWADGVRALRQLLTAGQK